MTHLIKPIKTIKRLKGSKKPKVRILDYGMQDQIDLIAYEGLEEQADHLVLDGRYLRCLFISGYPYIASSGWLSPVTNFNHDIDVSYLMHDVDAHESLPKLNRKITELESTKRSMIRSGQLVGPEVTDPLQSAQNLRDKIQRGQEKLFQVSIYMCLRARSLEELNKNTKLLESSLSSRLFFTKTARYMQLEALQSILPRGEDLLCQKRNLDSSSSALTFPFISSELVQETGILYG